MIGVCFSYSLSADFWKNLGIEKSEKDKIARLMGIPISDLIIMNNPWPNSDLEHNKLKKMKLLYVPGPYSLTTALYIKCYSLIRLGKNIPITIRFGYMPDILFMRNNKFYSATKAMVLIILALIFCNNIFAVRSFKEHWLLKLRRKITWIDQTVSKDSIHYAPKKFKNRKIDFLYCGRLEQEKGANNLLKLKFGDCAIKVVGKGTYAAKVKEKYNKSYIEFISQKELSKIYANTKFLINLSISEGSPKVVLEALLNGCKVIALRDSFEKFDGFENEIFFYDSLKDISQMIETGGIFKNEQINKEHGDKLIKEVLFKRYTH